jgi:tetratricopeptide (TPR) repeat protein
LKRIIIILGLTGLVLTATATAAPTINCEVTVREKTAGTQGDFVLIEKKQIPVVDGIKNTSFIVNFTLDMTMSYNDSGYFDCEVSVFTLGPQAQTFFKKFQSQPGGVYFLNNVRGKEDIEYRVGICPVSIDSAKAPGAECDFDFRRDGVWNFDPSANFDFYFVPQSLADARWNLLRDFMEKNYKDFKELFQLTFPGKINCFLSPCVLPQVTWDSRMGYAIDPPRSNCFVLYSHDFNTVDPIPAYLLRIYRYLGYAPPLLAEGMAAYFEFPHYYARELRQSSQLPPLKALLKSVDYYSLTGHANISAASSFVKYLIDTYGLSRFRQLYKASSDLTIGPQFSTVYEKPLDKLEAEWHHCLDTVTFAKGIYQYFYERDLYISRDAGMDEFLPKMKAAMNSYNDSVYVYSQEGWNQYMRGDYETARADYETLIRLAPTKADYLIIYGNLLLIDGRYDSARVMFNRVMAADTTVKTALNKIGEAYFWEKNLDSARTYLQRDMTEDPSQLSQASSGILLGEIALADGDRTAAEDYFDRALKAMEQIYQSGKTLPAYLLRLGQAHLGLAMCGESSLATAGSYLESALYFEVHPTRVIFVTRILKELGRVADLEGKRQEAISYYQQALKYPLPPGLDAEIRQYVVTPFTGYKP